MSQPPAYEFEDDDAPKPERKAFIPGLAEAQSSAPAATAAPGQPSTARTVRPPTASFTQAPPTTQPPTTRTVAKKAPGTASITKPVEANDPDLKPGSRKDLWSCPHCGTRNNPARATCRECDKAPTDPVAKKWFQNPVVLGLIACGIAAVVGLWIITRPDLTLKNPGVASLARGGRTTVEREINGKTFTPRGRLSVCGRVLISRPASGADGVMTVGLLLGAADDLELAAAKPSFNNEIVSDMPAKSVVLNLITSDKLDLSKGAWLSVVGDYGQLYESGTIVRSTDVGDTVAVEQLRQQ